MAELSFSLHASQTLEDLMGRMEAHDALLDLDMDLADGVLTVVFEDDSRIILNRQEGARQLWMASPLGPAHFGFDPGSGRWIDDKTGEGLIETLERALTLKVGEAIKL